MSLILSPDDRNIEQLSYFWGTGIVPCRPIKSLKICPIVPILKPIFVLGPGIGLDPQCHNFALGIPTCWYLKTLTFPLPPTQNI